MNQTARSKSQSLKKSLTYLLGALLMMGLALTFVACAKPAAEPESTEPEAPAAPAVELQIFAANSLEKALPEVQALYTEKNEHITFIDTQFKGSGDLVTELQAGAPADILITASASTMDTAIEDGSVDKESRTDMFLNDLIVVKKAGSDVAITKLEDVNAEAITKIAIGDADAVPAGAYANQSLFTIGMYTAETGKGGEYEAAFATKVVAQSSVGNVAKIVSTGDAQIGFVYTSDLYRYDGIEEAFVVPSETHKKIIYPGAVVASSTYAEEAAAFLEFCLNDPDALKIWASYGFEISAS